MLELSGLPSLLVQITVGDGMPASTRQLRIALLPAITTWEELGCIDRIGTSKRLTSTIEEAWARPKLLEVTQT